MVLFWLFLKAEDLRDRGKWVRPETEDCSVTAKWIPEKGLQ